MATTSLQVYVASSLSTSKKTQRCGTVCRSFASTVPMPPLNPRDPFLSKFASVAAAASPDLLKTSSNSDTPPYLDLFDSPKLMASPAQVERSVSYNEHRPRKPPPDLPSLLLHGRIVYIGMPELKDAIKSSAMKIIVVRKGQLKLYARQPLAHVETTLRSSIK